MMNTYICTVALEERETIEHTPPPPLEFGKYNYKLILGENFYFFILLEKSFPPRKMFCWRLLPLPY